MRVLIAVMTCARYLDRRNAVRDTWMPFVDRLNTDVNVMFFSGKEPCLVDDSVGDIVHLDCPDTYNELPQKTYRLVEYARDNEYDLLIKVDDDTYFMPLPEYIEAFKTFVNLGSVREHPQHNDFVPYAQGGCYSLTQKGMDAVLTSPEHPITLEKMLFQTGIEDGAVGKSLGLKKIVPTHTTRIKTDYRHGIPSPDNDIISAHACTIQIMHEIQNANTLRLLVAYNNVLNKENPQKPEPLPQPDLSKIRQAETPVSDDGITITITSCGRHDLLRRTLTSLAKCVIDAPIRETIILEDSDARKPEWIDSGDNPIKGLGPIRWISNGRRNGQWMSLDRLMDEVKTEYVFGCEDDWEFDGRPFMAASLEMLKAHLSVIQVSLRGSDNTSGHPNIDADGLTIQEPYWRKYWGGFSGNPSLRRKSDWRRIGSYGKHTGYGNGGIVSEQTISKLYLDLGYRIAVLQNGPYVKHIGERRSKAIDKLPEKAKVLIAVPVCWKYAYGQHTIAVQRHTEGRIEAVRDTWAKDVVPFRDYVHLKFFYGRRPTNRPPQMKPDEIILNVPDDYDHLPHKMQGIYQYAIQHGYEYVFKADDDGFLYIDRLMRTDYEGVDQLGFSNCTHGLGQKCGCYITGGCGYFLSKKAMLAAIAEPIRPNDWAEDLITGRALRTRRCRRIAHPGFLPGFKNHYVDVDAVLKSDFSYVSLHAVKAADMQRLYEQR